MITGHLGVAAAARGRWPAVPSWWLLAACIVPDLLDVAYALAGVCGPYGLYSHTVPAAAIAAALLGGAAFLASGSRAAGAVVAGVVLAHLPLDFVTGLKLYWPGGPLLGLRLYEHRWLDFAVEVPIALAGWWLLRRSGRGPAWATTGLAAVALVVVQATFDLMPLELKPTACPASTAAP